MKKTFATFLVLFTFLPSALAATIVSEYQTVVDKNESAEIAPVMITSTSDGDINAKHGIRILLTPVERVLWGVSVPVIIGTAKDHGKVNLNVKPEYSADKKSVLIPVLEDFEAGEWLNISGLVLRGYDEGFNDQTLGLDLNGDLKADVEDINIYRVSSTGQKIDFVSPFPVTQVQHKLNTDGSVTFTWTVPPDYDYEGTIVDRNRVKGGSSQMSTVYNGYPTTFIDKDLKDVTSATYTFIAKDNAGNQSSPVVVELDFTEPEQTPDDQETPAEEPSATDPTPPTTPDGDEKIQELKKLLNYYQIRYNIKCNPSGRAVPLNDSACLWSRIDLVYAQTLTGKENVKNLTLSDQDLALMTSRRKWPEDRYQKNCVEAGQPANYCPALGKAIDRISYFLD